MSETFTFTGTARLTGKREFIRSPNGKMLAEPGAVVIESEDGRAVFIMDRDDYVELFNRDAPALGEGDGEPLNPPNDSDLPLEGTAKEPESEDHEGADPGPEFHHGNDQSAPADREDEGWDQTAPQDREGDPDYMPDQSDPDDRI